MKDTKDQLIEKLEEFFYFIIETQIIDSPFREDAIKYKKLCNKITSLIKQGEQEKKN